MNLSRAFYIPAFIAFLIGVMFLTHGMSSEAVLIGMLSTLIAIIGLCVAIRSARVSKSLTS